MILQRWLAVAVALLGAGCAPQFDAQGIRQVSQLVEDMNARQMTSCLWYQGSAGPYGFIRGVTATGGAALEMCIKER